MKRSKEALLGYAADSVQHRQIAAAVEAALPWFKVRPCRLDEREKSVVVERELVIRQDEYRTLSQVFRAIQETLRQLGQTVVA